MPDTAKTKFKLGKRPPRLDPRTFKLERYTAALPPAPPGVYYQGHVAMWPMMLNDSLGDCVCAASGHMIEQWTTYVGAPFTPTDDEILKAYEVIGGYVPGDPSTDNGCDMLTALNTWRLSGIAGHQITAFASILGTVSGDPIPRASIMENLKLSVLMFGNCYLGLALPLSVQWAPSWHIDDSDAAAAAPGSWGGHCVPAVGYDEETITVVTWGGLLNMSWNFFLRYCDEGYAVLSRDWIEGTGLAPSSFDWNTLQEDLQKL